MNREDRAKQFLPFDAMKGLKEAMERQEELLSRVERIELGEEDAERLSLALSQVERGDLVRVTCFLGGHYRTLSGTVTRLDPVKRLLILDERKLPFDDLTELERLPKDHTGI